MKLKNLLSEGDMYEDATDYEDEGDPERSTGNELDKPRRVATPDGNVVKSEMPSIRDYMNFPNPGNAAKQQDLENFSKGLESNEGTENFDINVPLNKNMFNKQPVEPTQPTNALAKGRERLRMK